MFRSAVCALLLVSLMGCTTFALSGRVDRHRVDREGDGRLDTIVGLLVVPTPSGNPLVLLPLWKSSRLTSVRGGVGTGNLPPAAARWLEENAQPGQSQM